MSKVLKRDSKEELRWAHNPEVPGSKPGSARTGLAQW